MKRLTVNTFFSGIGCQERGFENSGVFDIEVLSTSDIAKESTVSYAAIHNGLTPELIQSYQDFPTANEMADYLEKIDLGYDPMTDKHYDWHRLVTTPNNVEILAKYYLASVLSKNVGNISRIESLPYADLWFCSFPYTDISQAGKMRGLCQGSGTRSSLLWENIRLLREAIKRNEAPKYLMIENVKNLVSSKFKADFLVLLDILKELGYNSYWNILDGKTCGVPQSRPRVFVVSIRGDIDKGTFMFPRPYSCPYVIKDMLDPKFDKKYYLSDKIQSRFKLTDPSFSKSVIGTTAPEFRTIGQRDVVYQQDGIMGALVATDYKQPKQILDIPMDAVTYDTSKVRIRKIMPREAARFMGFTFDDCDRAQRMGVSDGKLYEQFGNGIITNCVKLIAQHLYKAQYDNSYICEDETHL